MQHLDIILFLLALLAGLYSVADRIKVSYPILLVVAGLGISLIPGLPAVHLTPDVAFLLFLPPLLFDAARHMSWHDFRKNQAIIGRLAIGLVLFSTAGVAVCAYYMIPGFTWPLAFVLGAIVSPPDAVAATSATKGLNLPKRLVAVLEGESLINDATALVTYRYAVAAVLSTTFVLWQAALQFVLVAGGGVIVGGIIGYGFVFVQRRFLRGATVETLVTLLLPFVSYVLAEKFHASGVLAAVTAGLFVSWRAHEIFSYQTRMQMNNFWDVLIFLLNGLVFILIGLQLPEIINSIGDHTFGEMVTYGLLISAVVIATRLIWVFPTAHLANWFYRMLKIEKSALVNNRYLLILGWSGMRGVVSLATALALPLTLENGADFPERNTILFITFVVILVTLVFQGLTLPWLIKWLKLGETPEKAMTEERRLRLVMANAAYEFVETDLQKRMDPRALENVKNRLERQISYLNGVLKVEGNGHAQEAETYGPITDYHQSEKEIVSQQRKLLIQMHKKGAFSAEVLRKIEQDLDARSLMLEGRQAFIKS
ncbi:MAG: Na+/H+ antiporter [Micavibrio sp.]|nr:Na+/H+ antiporter [Micavibrio sp.]